MANSKILFKTDTICVECFFKKSRARNSIAIVFSSFGNRSLVGNPYGGNFLFENGFDVISFKSTRDDWFQSLPKMALELAARVCKKYKYVIAMGTSMGGFAAICFSKYFSCERVLAYSPQFRIKDGFDPRFSYVPEMERIYEISRETIKDNCKYTFVYDKCDYDRFHIDELRNFIPEGNFIELTLPHVGHELSIYLYEVGLIKDVTISLLRGERLDKSKLLKGRRASRVYLKGIANKLLLKNKHKSALVIKELQIRAERAHSEERIRVSKVEFSAMAAKILRPNAFSEFVIRWKIQPFYHLVAWYEAWRLISIGFDTELYLIANPDVERMGVNPVLHYAHHGRREGRVVFFR